MKKIINRIAIIALFPVIVLHALIGYMLPMSKDFERRNGRELTELEMRRLARFCGKKVILFWTPFKN